MISMSDPAQDFRNVQQGIDLLKAYRGNMMVPVPDNPAWQKALGGLVEGMTTHEEFEAEMGRVVQGLVIFANILAEDLAKNSGSTTDEVVRLYEKQTQRLIAQLKPE
jgi:hypothetical protein